MLLASADAHQDSAGVRSPRRPEAVRRALSAVRDEMPAILENTAPWAPPPSDAVPDGSDRAFEPIAKQTIAGRYHVNSLLGAGGMGSVWLARDEVLRRSVALKQVMGRRQALQEARAAARITHPGVVTVHDVIVEDDGQWIVMEALQGRSLSAVIREQGRLPLDEVVRIALHLLSALEAIHDAGLVHRDVKPSNVQLCGERVVLTDFGLSSPSGVTGGAQAGTVDGSLPYLAPESIVDGVFGPASDLYALGVTLYQAIEGQLPFDPGTPLTMLDLALRRHTRRASHAGRMSRVVRGLLANDPAARMNAAQARAALLAIEAPAPMATAI